MDALGKYTAELVHAQLEMRKPRPVPDRISVEELVQIAETHQMQYLLLGALLRAEGLSEEWKGKLRGRVLLEA